MKHCRLCGETKTLDSFSKHGRGLRSYCRTCANARSLAWHKANRERHRELNRQWWKRNGPRVLAEKRARYIADPEYRLAWAIRNSLAHLKRTSDQGDTR